MSKIIVSLFALIILIPVSCAEDQISLRFKYKLNADIFVLTAGDINADGLNEVIVSSNNTLYILDKDGNLMHDYGISSPGKISAADIADLDYDGRNEIIIGTGWMEKTDINEDPFYLSGLTMIEKTKRLIKTIENKGRIYSIDGGIVSKFQDVDGWVRSIDVSDGKIVVGTGGSNIAFFEEIIYSNGSKIRNYTDYASWAGSIFIFNKTGLIREYTANNTFYSIFVYNIYGDLDEEIIAGSGSTVSAFYNNLTLLWNYSAMGDVKNIYCGYLGSIDDKRAIVGFRSRSIDGIHVLNDNGMELWTYRMPFQSSLLGLSIGNLDADDDNEVIAASENTIYVLDNAGKVILKFWIDGGIDRIYPTDLDANGYMDLIISSKNIVTVYEVTETLIKKQLADSYYENAGKFYNSRDYRKAEEYIKNATKLYIEINDIDGISGSDLLSCRISEGIRENRRIEANSLYSNALSYYGFNNYTSAIDYAKKSIEVYTEINDTDGISRAESLIATIKNKTANITEGTTTTLSTIIHVHNNGTSNNNSEISNSIIFIAIIIIAILITLIFIRTRRR